MTCDLIFYFNLMITIKSNSIQRLQSAVWPSKLFITIKKKNHKFLYTTNRTMVRSEDNWNSLKTILLFFWNWLQFPMSCIIFFSLYSHSSIIHLPKRFRRARNWLLQVSKAPITYNEYSALRWWVNIVKVEVSDVQTSWTNIMKKY